MVGGAALCVVLRKGKKNPGCSAAAARHEPVRLQLGEEERKKWLGLGLPTASRGFDLATFARGRWMMMDGWDHPALMWAKISPGGRAAQAEFPAQAQVAAWARGRAACWAEPADRTGPPRATGQAAPRVGRLRWLGRKGEKKGLRAKI
jgi:hypothetical protein